MLYARWREVAAQYARFTALWDCRSGRAWSFAELASAVEREPPAAELERPSEASTGFVLAVLRAWRDGRPVCPLDEGQGLPEVSSLPPLPAGVVHLKQTSATTGVPRWVAFSAAQLAADAEKIVEMMGLRPDWPNLGVISLAHSYGFSNLVLPLLLHGIPLILAEAPLPETLRRAATRWEALTLPAVPALWRAWHDAGAISSSIRLAISAGAPLPVQLERAIHAATGLKVHNFYGATECGGIAYDPTPEPRTDEAWVGKPMPGVAVSVADDGCLEVRGPSVGTAYLPDDGAILGNGRYHSRDLADVGPDGIFLRGRASDLINVAGRKLAPERVEAVIASHPGVEACVVFGTPDDDALRQDRVVAVVALRAVVPGKSNAVTEAELRAHALARLESWQVPREWRWVPEIPVNARGKVSRAAWRQRFLAGELSRVPTPRG